MRILENLYKLRKRLIRPFKIEGTKRNAFSLLKAHFKPIFRRELGHVRSARCHPQTSVLIETQIEPEAKGIFGNVLIYSRFQFHQSCD